MRQRRHHRSGRHQDQDESRHRLRRVHASHHQYLQKRDEEGRLANVYRPVPAFQDVPNGSVQYHQVGLLLTSDFRLLNMLVYSRIKKLKTFKATMETAGTKKDSIGCEICKPAVGSILASLYNEHVMDPSHHANQDTNDRFMANIQRNGTFSVIPRVTGGEIQPDHLIALGEVAKEYNLYSKITGGQRIDLFGAQKRDLPAIWKKLNDAGLEGGLGYAKALRTVKSCVGSTWCRYGIGDSVGLAIQLENRYKVLRAPHKIKGGVSGCVRECAEAQSKDFGLIATDKGWNSKSPLEWEARLDTDLRASQSS